MEESQQRIVHLRGFVQEAERALNDVGPLFSAEQQRLSAAFRRQWERFTAQARPAARGELTLALRGINGRPGRARDQALELAQTIAKRWIDRWYGEAEPAAEALYHGVAQRFVELANAFLDRLATSEDALVGLPRTFSLDSRFRIPSRFYSTGLMHLTGRSPLRWIPEALQPTGVARRRREHEATDYLQRLISTNTARVMNDLDERVLESRRRLEHEIRKCLHDV